MEVDEIDDATSKYLNVLHKERVGELTLTESAATFRFQPVNGNVNSENTAPEIRIEWKDVIKHQVSPAKYPKALLKILVNVAAPATSTGTAPASLTNNPNKSTSSLTFQLVNRDVLEQIRRDVTNRLHKHHRHLAAAGGGDSTNGKKRPHSEMNGTHSNNRSSFGTFDPTAMAVTRAALLASNEALRQQHKYLVTDTNTVTEDDFWSTHQHLIEDEYARISGMAKPGTSSLLQSHLPNSGRVTLGVQEMRQIFILYPAVHKAYEEKVPLELSDEQFWRKYLESEYFHRDRGRIGTAARNQAALYDTNNNQSGSNNNSNNNKANSADDTNGGKKKPEKNGNNKGPTFEQQEARAAAVGSDDLFSRYDQKLKEEAELRDKQQPNGPDAVLNRRWGTHLAVGQFDLASTMETERGKLLEGPKDNFPPNPNDDGKGSRVIQKYNRHWAMVLYPDEAVAGSNLLGIARRSARDVVPDDNDALVQGGVDTETRRLVDFANTREEDANHATAAGQEADEMYEPLTLQNIEAYFAGSVNSTGQATSSESTETYIEYAKKTVDRAQAMVNMILADSGNRGNTGSARLPETCFPPPLLGRELLAALTKKMAKDSETEAQSLEMASKLPTDLRNRLQSYFRRSSELLRHFFGLRRLAAESGDVPSSTISAQQTSQKLAKIVGGMDTLYREMDVMRKALTQVETDEMMRKMCLPIMDQLDWAFKLYREGSGSGSSGGFVTVEEL